MTDDGHCLGWISMFEVLGLVCPSQGQPTDQLSSPWGQSDHSNGHLKILVSSDQAREG